jgi:hypothetical protein
MDVSQINDMHGCARGIPVARCSAGSSLVGAADVTFERLQQSRAAELAHASSRLQRATPFAARNHQQSNVKNLAAFAVSLGGKSAGESLRSNPAGR